MRRAAHDGLILIFLQNAVVKLKKQIQIALILLLKYSKYLKLQILIFSKLEKSLDLLGSYYRKSLQVPLGKNENLKHPIHYRNYIEYFKN